MTQDKRNHPRSPVEAHIACSLLTTRVDIEKTQCVVRNYSPNGVYIETECGYKRGAVLVVRISEADPEPLEAENEMRSVGLAEVRWVQQLGAEVAPWYGIGLKYLS